MSPYIVAANIFEVISAGSTEPLAELHSISSAIKLEIIMLSCAIALEVQLNLFL